MGAQKHLVDTLGLFYPKIVKMDGTPPRNRRRKDISGE
jgi:tRNA-splicing ligase RtcB